MALNLGGAGDTRKKLLIVAVLAGAAVFAVASLIIGLSGSDKMTEGWDDVHFICQETHQHFVRKYQDLPGEFLEKSALGQMVFLDCPKCGRKNCAAPAIRCPNPECGKYYARYYKDAASGESKLNAKCPHCGTVPHEWDRKHRKR